MSSLEMELGVLEQRLLQREEVIGELQRRAGEHERVLQGRDEQLEQLRGKLAELEVLCSPGLKAQAGPADHKDAAPAGGQGRPLRGTGHLLPDRAGGRLPPEMNVIRPPASRTAGRPAAWP
jgi:hypothetical protein